MSDHHDLPEFSDSGDAREEALWQAYQAMLRRRKEPRARWSALEEPSSEPTSAPVPPPQAPATRTRSGRSAAGWLAIFGSALVLAGGTTLAIVLWPRSPAAPHRSAPLPAPTDVVSPPAPSPMTTPAPPPTVEANVAPKSSAASGPGVQAPSDRSAKRPRSPAPPAKPPRDAAARLAPDHGDEGAHGAAGEVSTARSPGLAVREFYNALAQGDGARAAAVVAPEKRDDGPLSAGELTRTYASLRSPIRITKIETLDDDKVFVRYHFVTADNHVCLGSAIVDTTRRDGGALVSGIHVFHGC